MSIEEYRRNKIEQYKLEREQNVEKYGRVNGVTDKEYNSMKIKQKSSVTRRVHSRGNLWNHHNLPRIKANISVWYK